MAGTWPMLDASDLETRVRTYLNEVTADFYTQADIYRWLSIAAKDIAQKTTCVRRVLRVVTATSTRTVATSAYKTLHVEYVPSSGRAIMLTKIDPLRVGHYPLNGTAPQYWYEFGTTIGIEPLPDAIYNLNLYVADLPKFQNITYPITAFNTGWTSTSGVWGTWSSGAAINTYAGTNGLTGTTTYGTALGTSANYTIGFTLNPLTRCSLVMNVGTAVSPAFTTAGYYTINVTTGTGTNMNVVVTVNASTSGTVGLDDVYISKEGDFGTAADQIELPSMWQHLLALYATYCGLNKNKKDGPAKMLETIYRNEITFLRQNVVEIVPDGIDNFKYGA